MIHHFGVRGGRMTLNRLVELLATSRRSCSASTPAKARSPSARTQTSSSSTRTSARSSRPPSQHSKSDYNLYEGTEVMGAPEVVLVRGTVVVENDELVAARGTGVRQARPLRRAAEAGRAVA